MAAATNLGRVKIFPRAVQVWRAEFRRLEAEGKGSYRSDANFTIGVKRVSETVIHVELTALSVDDPQAEFAVTARVEIEVQTELEGRELDKELAAIASRVGPVIVFPYIRELIADLSRRSGIVPITLPVINIGAMFDVPVEALKLQDPTVAAKRVRKAKELTGSRKAAVSKPSVGKKD